MSQAGALPPIFTCQSNRSIIFLVVTSLQSCVGNTHAINLTLINILSYEKTAIKLGISTVETTNLFLDNVNIYSETVYCSNYVFNAIKQTH